MGQTAQDDQAAKPKLNLVTIGAVLVALLVVVGIGLATLIPRDPDAAVAYEISKRERKIEKLNQEVKTLKQELHQVRDDYAKMVAERRCEVIDGMDDCLAAGFTRPERFRESDAALVREREAAKARQLAEESRAQPSKPESPQASGKASEGGMSALIRLLEKIPGVKTD